MWLHTPDAVRRATLATIELIEGARCRGATTGRKEPLGEADFAEGERLATGAESRAALRGTAAARCGSTRTRASSSCRPTPCG